MNQTKKIILTLVVLMQAALTWAQVASVTLSGQVKEASSQTALAYVNIVLKTAKDSAFVSGTVSNEEGRFTLTGIKTGSYTLECSFLGYKTLKQSVLVGQLSEYMDLGTIELRDDAQALSEVTISAEQDALNAKMDKKTFNLNDNISQNGGSVLQSMQNLPGVTVQDNKVQLRGSDKVVILIDGKQTALTGFGNQTSLDNIPASAIEKIEIINNPSSKFDANGNAGIINIIYKKNKQEGFNGTLGLSSGLGALWIKRENLPDIRPQFRYTPKVNPSLFLAYRKNKLNVFVQGDYLYTQTLNKNEFVERNYDNAESLIQQTKRNRTTTIGLVKAGADWTIDAQNTFNISGLFSSEKILDNGDEPFFNTSLSERKRLWQFLEDELKTTATLSANYQHKFKEAGHVLNASFNYTFHREDEKYFFTNILPTYTGKDSFKLISDEQVADLNIDYTKPLRHGKFEGGMKLRRRYIPTNMLFLPGVNSPLDTNAGGWANYKETIPALYGNYVYESKHLEIEAGLRVEYVDLKYQVNPEHRTYRSNGYSYTQPFPNLRFAYKLDDQNKLSLFYNRRVDRPNEVDIRIFPKYDDAEIIKVGNPALRPQFTNTVELGYKRSFTAGYFYSALYYKLTDGTITRVASTVSGSNLIYNIFQNTNRSSNTGMEVLYSYKVNAAVSFNFNMNAYYAQIDSFSVTNEYPVQNTVTSAKQALFSGNAKFNTLIHLPKQLDVQLSAVYLAPDLIPQGRIGTRFSLDLGIKKRIQKGKGEIFLNATDLLNTMQIKKTIQGNGFNYVSRDYYETQVIRVGYNFKF